jgi:hypothetical protein
MTNATTPPAVLRTQRFAPAATHSEQEHDMKASDLLESKYLKKEDVDPPKLLTVAGLEKINMAKQDQPPEMKWALKFQEAKPMVMNSINIQLATAALGKDTDEWIGKKIVAYHDPNVTFQGKLTGGIRLRAPKPGAAAPAPEPEFNDDIPF